MDGDLSTLLSTDLGDLVENHFLTQVNVNKLFLFAVQISQPDDTRDSGQHEKSGWCCKRVNMRGGGSLVTREN